MSELEEKRRVGGLDKIWGRSCTREKGKWRVAHFSGIIINRVPHFSRFLREVGPFRGDETPLPQGFCGIRCPSRLPSFESLDTRGNLRKAGARTVSPGSATAVDKWPEPGWSARKLDP